MILRICTECEVPVWELIVVAIDGNPRDRMSWMNRWAANRKGSDQLHPGEAHLLGIPLKAMVILNLRRWQTMEELPNLPQVDHLPIPIEVECQGEGLLEALPLRKDRLLASAGLAPV